jgi:hypothetical protein
MVVVMVVVVVVVVVVVMVMMVVCGRFMKGKRAHGTRPCKHKRCETCSCVNTADTIENRTTGRKFLVQTSATCKTENVVYMFECKKCRMQYVGETGGPLHRRLNGHRSDIKRNTGTTVSAHFNQPGHTVEDLTVMVIEKIHGDKNVRKSRERHWVHTLGTLAPAGMNLV